jgi:hypothetical protein
MPFAVVEMSDFRISAWNGLDGSIEPKPLQDVKDRARTKDDPRQKNVHRPYLFMAFRVPLGACIIVIKNRSNSLCLNRFGWAPE